MRYLEPEIMGIIDPFSADILNDTMPDIGGQSHNVFAPAPAILPDGTEVMYDEFGNIVEAIGGEE